MLDQPATEVKKLEAVLHAFSRYEELQNKRNAARNKNRTRHAHNVERETIK